jgi:hypothetical protein
VVAEVVSIPELERLGEQISSFRFVPGGKLLLLTSPSIIQLWDLGVSEPLKPRCLASCERALTPREERAHAEGRELKEGEIVICLIDELDGKILFSLSLSSDSTRQADSLYELPLLSTCLLIVVSIVIPCSCTPLKWRPSSQHLNASVDFLLFHRKQTLMDMMETRYSSHAQTPMIVL